MLRVPVQDRAARAEIRFPPPNPLLLGVLYLCPNCHSHRVAPSNGPFDWIFRLFGRKPYWCALCSTRFYFPDPQPA